MRTLDPRRGQLSAPLWGKYASTLLAIGDINIHFYLKKEICSIRPISLWIIYVEPAL